MRKVLSPRTRDRPTRSAGKSCRPMTKLSADPHFHLLNQIGSHLAAIMFSVIVFLPQHAAAQNNQCSMMCNGSDNACYRTCAGPAYEQRPSGSGGATVQGVAGPRYGSIAVSDSSNSSGTSWRHPNVARADAVALRYCNQGTPAKDCRIVGRAEGGCAALARESPSIWGGASRGTRAEAEAVARAKCRQAGGQACPIQASFCN